MASNDELSSMLRAAGLRRTPVRVEVLRALVRSNEPLAVPRLLAKLPEHTDAVTVYRTLNSFTRKKLVHRVRGEDRTWRYALGGTLRTSAHQHPHFICQECGRVECLDNAEIPERFIRSFPVAKGYEVAYAEVLLHGLCARCQA